MLQLYNYIMIVASAQDTLKPHSRPGSHPASCHLQYRLSDVKLGDCLEMRLRYTVYGKWTFPFAYYKWSKVGKPDNEATPQVHEP